MYRGWYQVAFERELTGGLTAAEVGDHPLVLVRCDDTVAAFDAACPHRGAHLGRGGRLDDGAIICPFHGHRVELSEASVSPYRARRYPTRALGGLVFVLLDDRHERGFGEFLEGLNRTHLIVQGFTLTARTSPELVIENGFDHRHFRLVHGLEAVSGLTLRPGEHGELLVEGAFLARSSVPWLSGSRDGQESKIRLLIRVFSPALCVTELGDGHDCYQVISGATPTADGRCAIRVSVAVPPAADGARPDPRVVHSLLRDSKASYEQDIAIWESLVPGAPPRFDDEDRLVLEFHRFCRGFLAADR